MADKKTSLIEQINKNTGELVKETKTFGPKLPSKSEQSEQTETMVESIESINTILTGSFAHLIFGQANKRKFSDLNGLVGKSTDDTIFGNILGIAKVLGAKKGTTAENFGTQLAKGMSNSKEYFTKLESSLKKTIKATIKDLEVVEKLSKINSSLRHIKLSDLTTYAEMSAEYLEDIKKIISDINTDDMFVLSDMSTEYLESISNSTKQFSTTSLETKLDISNTKLNEIYNVVKKKTDEDIMHEVIVKLQATKNLTGLVDLLKQLNNTSVNAKTYKALDDLNKLTSKNGPLYALLKNVENLDIDAIKIMQKTNGMASIKKIIEVVSNSAKVGIKDVIRFRTSIFWIKHFIIGGLIDTINKMEKMSRATADKQKSIQIGVQNFLSIIETFEKTTEFGFWKSLRIRFNLYNLANIISSSLREVLVSLSETLNDNTLTSNDINEKMTILNNFIKTLSMIADKKQLNIDSAKDQLDSLNSLVQNQLQELIKSISALNAKDESSRILAIQNNVDSLSRLASALPKWMQLFNMVLKTNLLIAFVKEVSSLVQNINKIPKVALHKNQISDLTDKHLTGLVEIGQLANYTDFKKYSEDIKKTLIPYVKDIINLFNEIDKFQKLNIDINKLKQIDIYLTKFNKLPVDKLPKQANMLKLLDIEKIVNEFAKNFNADSFAMNEHIDELIENLKIFVIAMSSKGIIGNHIKDIVDLTKNDLSKLNNIIKYLDQLSVVVKKLTVIEKLTSKMPKNAKDSGLVKLTNALKVAVENINKLKLDEKKIKALNKSLNTLAKFVITSAGILLFGALMMMVIPVANVALFAVTLGTFVWAMMRVFKGMNKQIKLSIAGAKAFSILLIVSAATLLFAGFVAQTVPVEGLIKFVIFQTLFIYALSFPYRRFLVDSKLTFAGAAAFSILLVTTATLLIAGSLFWKYINWVDAFSFIFATSTFILLTVGAYILPQRLRLFKSAATGIFEFTVLMAASAIVTIAGSLFFKAINWSDALKFVGMTALFIGAMILALAFPKLLGGGFKLLGMIPGAGQILGLIGNGLSSIDPLKEAKKGLFDFAVLIFAAGMTMALGAYISKNIPWTALFGFATSLALFMVMTLAPLLALKGSMTLGEHTGKQFGKIVVISAATMIIGGLLFTWFPGIKQGVLEFALVHGLYMTAISFSMWLFSKAKPETMMKDAFKLMLITIVSAGVLVLAGLFMEKYPHAKTNIPIFTGCLLLYILGMTLALRLMPKAGQLMQGVMAIGLLVLITGLAALAMQKVGELSKQVSWVDLLNGIAQLGVGLLLLGGAYWTFGYLFFLDGGLGLGLATLALTAISGLTFLSASAMKFISQNQQHFDQKKIKKFKSAITAFGDLGKELVDKFGSPWTMLRLPMATASVISLSYALSMIAKAVEEYANLKVSVYEGTKVVGYRQLKKSDFKEAATNVKLIITTLGGAVIETYDKKPEIFETNLFGTSKFAKVTKSLRTLGPMLSDIARAVKDYANLKVSLYEGTKVVGYRQLNEGDFQEAAKNVKEIIVTLGGAVIETYDKKPEIFETNFFGTSKFAKVTKSLKTLSPLLSSIARSVKDYADLKIADDWKEDKNGKLVVSRYRHLNDSDFESAATNVTHIISTLGGAIIDAYEAHPDYYETSLFGTSKFAKTVNANITLAKLISRIGKAVADISNLKVATDWYTDGKNIGKPKAYEQLTEKHFQNAAKNILTIITTLGKPIEDIANSDKFELYDSVSGFMGIGGSTSKFIKVIDGNIKLASLISRIGSSVKDMANLKMPVEFNAKDGSVKTWKTLDNSDFRNAAKNILTIITTLGTPIESIAKNENRMKLYEEASGFLGIGAKKSPFSQVINGNLKLAELIGKIGQAVKDMAGLKIATGYDKDGKAKGYEVMGKKHFDDAAKSIDSIITTLGKSIMDSYNSHKEWFKDGDDSIFAQACTAISSMGNMISQIAGGISAYAQLKIPNWAAGVNEDGTPKKYMEMNETTFRNAAKAINSIVTHIGNTVIDTYKAHESWFDDGEDSDFVIACTCIGHMGEMIGSIAEGIKSYAELKIPTEYDKEGNPIKFRELNNTDFKNAAQNISDVISAIGSTVVEQFDKHKDWFEVKSEGASTPFQRVMEGCTAMGEMIGAIAEGVQMYAAAKMPTGFDKDGKPMGFTQLNKTTYKEAADTISNIITCIGGAIDKTFYDHKKWFENKPLKKRGGFLGLMSVEEPDPSDPPFIKAVKGIGMMGGLIGSIAEGVQMFASMKIPTGFDTDGKPTGFEKMDPTMHQLAAQNIGDVITVLGKALNDTYTKNISLFVNPNLPKIMNAFTQMGLILSTISLGIQNYAVLSVPDEIDPSTGKGKSYRKVKSEDFIAAGENISKVLLCVGTAIEDVANGETFTRWNSERTIDGVIKMYAGITPVIGNLAKVIQSYSSMKIPTKFDKKGNPIEFTTLNSGHIKSAGDNIGNVLTAIGNAIVNTVSGNEKIFGDPVGLFGNSVNENPKASPAYRAAIAISEITKPLATMAELVSMYSLGKFPYITKSTDSEGKQIIKQSNVKINFKTVEQNIKNVLLALVNPLNDIIHTKEFTDIFTIKEDNKTLGELRAAQITEMAKQITAITEEMKKFGDIAIKDSTDKLSTIRTTLSTMINEVAMIAKLFGSPLNELTQTKVPMIQVTWGSDGTSTLGEYLANIQDKEIFEKVNNGINSLDESIANILTDIHNIVSTYNKNKSSIDKFLDNTIIDNIKTSIKNLSQLMTDVAVSISTFGIWYEEFEQQDKIHDYALVVYPQLITDTLSLIEESKKLIDVKLPGDIDSIENKYYKPIYDFIKVSTHAYDFLNDFGIVMFINKANNNITSIKNLNAELVSLYNVLNNIVKGVSNMENTFNTYDNSIHWLIDPYTKPSLESMKISETVDNVLKALTSTYDIINTISIDESEFDTQFELINTIIIKTSKIFALIDRLHKEFDEHITPYKDNNCEFDGLYNVVNTCRNAIGMLYDYVGNQTTPFNFGTPFAKFVDDVDNKVDINNLTLKLNKFNSTVRQLIEIIEYSEDTGLEGYQIIMQGLDGIMAKIAVLPKEDNFKKNVNQLERYVNAVNRIDLSKVIGLNNLAESLNVLASKMGNLDQLTETLATSIATVLNKLVEELKHAEKTIKDAKKLQESRHQLIVKATKEVKSIMDQKMLVEIKQIQDETLTEEGGSTSSTGGTSSSDSSAPTGASPNDSGNAGDQNNNGNTDDKDKDKDKKRTKSKKEVTVTTGGKNDNLAGTRSTSGGGRSSLSALEIQNAIVQALSTAHQKHYI